AATAVQPLTYEHVESWGGTGPGFNKHQAPAGIDTYGGAVFVADIDANAIEKKPLDSGSGTIWNYSEVASPALGRFTAPYDVAVVNDEVFYVADTGNNRVQRLERSTWTTVVATGSTAGKVQNPISIDVAPSGHFYVAEPG